jgi:hypothetical protein
LSIRKKPQYGKTIPASLFCTLKPSKLAMHDLISFRVILEEIFLNTFRLPTGELATLCDSPPL